MKTTHHEEQEVTDGLNPPIKNRHSPWMKAAAAMLIAVSAAGWAAPASAQAAMGAELMSLAEIERGFWVCDHAATNDRIDGSAAITCGSLTEVMKQRKFRGDFNAMLAWWRQHKETQHQAQTTRK